MFEAGRLNTQDCFQCAKCSTGCPVVAFMDYKPHQVIQMVNLGMTGRLLSCKTIWVCASCYTCTTRCPNDVDVAKVMDRLRQTALREKSPPAEKEIVIFHNAFLQSVRTFGRVHELSLMGRYKMATKRYMDDARLGWMMFVRGKLRILPARVKDRKRVAGLFARHTVR
jgi:heterodisulfide reductase subunit C2